MDSKPSNPTAKDVQTAYRSEIERRLGELGWTKDDMDFPPWSPQRDAWIKFVEPFVPKDMNDEAWNDLRPKLIPLLEAYRESRLKEERDRRRTDRRNRLSQIYSSLIREVPPLVSFEISEFRNPESSRSKTVSQDLAFPEMVDALQWPVIKSMLEADTTADELEQTFNSHRAEIDALATEWRNRLHRQMVDTIPRPDGEILRPTLVVDKSDPFKDLPDETKLLLRADSLFLINKSTTKVLTYQDVSHFTRTEPMSSMDLGIIKPEIPLDIENIAKFPLARGIAEVLLKSMGCPDASYLELEGMWTCGRCHDGEPRTWRGMVEHYVQEQLFYFATRADVRNMNITYHELHDPTLFTDRPLIKYFTGNIVLEGYNQLMGRKWQCRICAKHPIRRDVRGPEGKILKHLLDAHEIQTPKLGQHYGSPVPVDELNNLIGVNARDLDLFDDEQAASDDEGGEMYDYAEYGMYEQEEDSEYDSDIAAWLGFGYNPDEWAG